MLENVKKQNKTKRREHCTKGMCLTQKKPPSNPPTVLSMLNMLKATTGHGLDIQDFNNKKRGWGGNFYHTINTTTL